MKEMYGFNSENVPPVDDQLSGFENDIYEMANNIQFRRVQNPFLQKLASDVRIINESNEVSSQQIRQRTSTKYHLMNTRSYSKTTSQQITRKQTPLRRPALTKNQRKSPKKSTLMIVLNNMHKKMHSSPSKIRKRTLRTT